MEAENTLTSVILTVGPLQADLAALSQIQAWLMERGLGRLDAVPVLGAVGQQYAGLPDNDFANFVLERPWVEPERVVLVLQRPDRPTRVFRPTWQR